MSERLVVRGGFVVSMDPEIGEIPNADVLVEDGKIVEIGPKLEVARRRGDRRVREARDAGLHRHAPAHVADAGARRAPVLHPRRLLRRHARQDRPQLPARGRLHREPTRARSRRSTPGSRRCSTGRTSRTRPSTPTRPCTGSRTPASAASTPTASRATTAGGPTATGAIPEDIRRIREQYFASDDQLLTLAMAARAVGQRRRPRSRSTTGRWRASSASGSPSTSACA